jgi:hypothetical protein
MISRTILRGSKNSINMALMLDSISNIITQFKGSLYVVSNHVSPDRNGCGLAPGPETLPCEQQA